LNYKGRKEWRLPNVAKLKSLVKIDATSPTIDASAFPNTPSSSYWSSTISTPNPASSWSVNFSNGGTYVFQSNYNHVCLVRGGQSFDPFAHATLQVITFGVISSFPVGGTAALRAYR
jgi:hypothetical protein